MRRADRDLCALAGAGDPLFAVDKKGRPGLLQLAVIAREFREVIRFTKPPAWVQAALFGPLAALGRGRGLRATYPHHRDLVVSTSDSGVSSPAG